MEFLEQDPLLLEMLEDVLFFEPESRDIPFSQPKKLMMEFENKLQDNNGLIFM